MRFSKIITYILKKIKNFFAKNKKACKFLKKEFVIFLQLNGCSSRIIIWSVFFTITIAMHSNHFFGSSFYLNNAKKYISKPDNFKYFLSPYLLQNTSINQVFLNQYFAPEPSYNEFLTEHYTIIDNSKALKFIIFTFIGNFIVTLSLTVLVFFYSFKINLLDISFKNFRIITPRKWSLKILFFFIWISIGMVFNNIFMKFSLTEISFLRFVQVLITQGFVFYLLIRTKCCDFKMIKINQSKVKAILLKV